MQRERLLPMETSISPTSTLRTWLDELKIMWTRCPRFWKNNSMDRNKGTCRRQRMETDLRRFVESTATWPSAVAKEWVVQFVQMAYDQPDIRAIVAFGSIVRDVSYSVDVDLLFVGKLEIPEFTTPPLDVDLRAYCQSDVESLVAKGHDLLCWSIRFGTVIHEKNRYWKNLYKRWARRLPFPSAGTADERAERARRLLEDLRVIGDDDAVHEQLITMLTHLARAHLIRADVFPASRPELPRQLRSIGEFAIASKLTDALKKRRDLIGT